MGESKALGGGKKITKMSHFSPCSLRTGGPKGTSSPERLARRLPAGREKPPASAERVFPNSPPSSLGPLSRARPTELAAAQDEKLQMTKGSP